MVNWYRYDNSSHLILKLYIQPGAKNTAVTGLHAGNLKIKLAVLPIDGRANKCLVRFLADCFQVPISQIEIKEGNKSRQKVLLIRKPGLNPNVLYDERIAT
ncbi:DUF167 domain-containing protein [Nitrosomonas sp. PY1]|uniref:DUF167 domain-containing protein n=1 Tax=Nitrosomonas sp. PY1 TaxID=1803906 RepID=UPI001FC8853A|nr:DUF167 domain-containing protein [Nitrosomonas sp. PY1]